MEQAMIFTFPFQSTKFRSGPDKTDGKGKSRTKIRKKGGLDNNLVLLIASAVVDLTQDMSSCYCQDM